MHSRAGPPPGKDDAVQHSRAVPVVLPWSPDGSRIVFGSNRKGIRDLYQKPSSGAGSEELLLESPEDKAPNSWSLDGRFLLYTNLGPKGADLSVLPLDGDRKPFVFLSTRFDERVGQFSPDGHWVAYQSNESGRNQIHVRPFSGPGGQSLVSTTGGIQPRWRPDGEELYLAEVELMLASEPAAAAFMSTPALDSGCSVVQVRSSAGRLD